DYRSFQSGPWNQASTWEIFNGNTWVSASFPPTSDDGNITILNNHTVTITSNITIDQVTIESGAVLQVQPTGGQDIKAIVGEGQDSGPDLVVNGTLNLLLGGFDAGTMEVEGTLVLNDGGVIF